ncbi:MAG TPA: SCO family protein, partial [Ktedonobacterales bacterium]|nr:SCO family protein [Ktedonobacterales bacterium]
ALSACAATSANQPAGQSPALQGTDMRSHPAPAFTLTDQTGKTLGLQSLRGHPVVLTFLDATCTEQCPLMIQYLNSTAQQFMTPQQVAQVAWVAISVNPNNTPAQAAAFLAKNKPVMTLRFLLGTQAQLAPLWKAYYIDVQPGQTDVVHTSGLYVIDQQGRERIWLDAGFDPSLLGADLKTLLAT